MSSLVLDFLSILVYDQSNGSNFYKIIFLKSFKFYKIVSKFKIVFERPKSWKIDHILNQNVF